MPDYKSIAQGLAGTLAACMLWTDAQAAPTTIPIGLNPGDTYRLAFVSSTTRDATSPDIADYNAFVSAAANASPALAALGASWTAIASTSAVDARDNTNTNFLSDAGVAIYLTDGLTKVAEDNADLWDGSVLSGLAITELGTSLSTFVWTGTGGDGNSSGPFYLGTTNSPRFGLSSATDIQWIAPIGATLPNQERSLYGISSLLTVPLQIPAPPVLLLFLLGLSFLAKVRCHLRNQSTRPPPLPFRTIPH